MILFTQWARNMALIASFATGLFNAALRALLNRPVAQLAHRAIFVPIAFTIIDYSFITSTMFQTIIILISTTYHTQNNVQVL